MLEILDHYDDHEVSVRTHLITLSNHRQAWDVSLGLFALAGEDAKMAFDFITFLYANQDRYYNDQFLHKTHNDLIELVADLAVEFAEVERDSFIAEMRSSGVYLAGRTQIRYAATRAVWATPTLFINNADDVPVNHESDLAAWRAVLDPLLGK